jgi:hypothetical protein
MIYLFKRIVPLFLVAQSFFSFNQYHKRVQDCVKQQIELYPESHLIDIYKYFFQDVFGPGHLAPDSVSALRYLDFELSESVNYDSLDFQELNYRKQFVRVNLSVLDYENITKEDFLLGFLRSANDFKIPAVSEWQKEWASILEVIVQMNLQIPEFDQDVRYIDSMLNAGKYFVHHSSEYIHEYEPHYRIFNRKEYELLKQCIN